MLIPALLTLLQAAAPSAVPPATNPANPLSALTLYTGSWTVDSEKTNGVAGRPDKLINRCVLTEAFYTCEQVVNGKSMALLIFTPGETPHTFHTQTVLPNGYAIGRGDLTLDGEHWTYSKKVTSDDGKSSMTYKTENYFHGPDHIHFVQTESADGVTYKTTNQGDEVRISL